MSDDPADGLEGPEEAAGEPVGVTALQLPDSVEVHPAVDLGADDPALVEDGSRWCIATRRQDGGRCQARAPRGQLLCNAHGQRLDPRLGGQALARKRREARAKAEQVVAMRRLGTRAAIQAVLAERQEQVQAAVRLLLQDAADESIPRDARRRAALAVLPFVDQALGRPTERVEQVQPDDASAVARMDTADLEALVAAGRARRLEAS